MTSPQRLLKAWNLRARKELGQNFLIHDNMAQRIVDQARLVPDDVVLEIGSGLGMMTLAIARQVRKVLAVEKDRHLVSLLRTELMAQGLSHVQIHTQNILKVAIKTLIADETQPLVVLGNLPYNISSQIVVKLIEERQLVDRAILMFQKELADRICAGPGSKAYGRLSVRLQYCADITPRLDVAASQFHPRPKVDSTVIEVKFKKRMDYAVADERLFARVIQAAFGQRRKNLRNALSGGGLLPLDRSTAEQLLTDTEIDPRCRAETLTVDTFVTLTNHIAAYLNSHC